MRVCLVFVQRVQTNACIHLRRPIGFNHVNARTWQKVKDARFPIKLSHQAASGKICGADPRLFLDSGRISQPPVAKHLSSNHRPHHLEVLHRSDLMMNMLQPQLSKPDQCVILGTWAAPLLLLPKAGARPTELRDERIARCIHLILRGSM